MTATDITTDESVSFSFLLAEARRERRMTQAEAAESCGLTQAAWSRWESGSRVPGVENLRILADFMGADIDEMSTLLEDATFEARRRDAYATLGARIADLESGYLELRAKVDELTAALDAH